MRQNERRNDYLIALAEHMTSLRVAENDIIGAVVLDHGRADVSGERALLYFVAVLRRNVDSLVQSSANEVDVEGWWSH